MCKEQHSKVRLFVFDALRIRTSQSDKLHLLIDPAQITDGFLRNVNPKIYCASGQLLEIIGVYNMVK